MHLAEYAPDMPWRLLVLVLVPALVLGACNRSTPAVPGDGLRPMEQVFGADLRALGWTVQRSEVQHRDLPGLTTKGKQHLALYLRPVGHKTAADYLDGLATATRVLVPAVFARWPGLQSFDVCEEPAADVDPSDEPKPVTQVLVTRSQALAVDWPRATTEEVVRRGLGHPNTITLYLSPELQQAPEFLSVSAMAGVG
jgi:hypothetical protein